MRTFRLLSASAAVLLTSCSPPAPSPSAAPSSSPTGTPAGVTVSVAPSATTTSKSPQPRTGQAIMSGPSEFGIMLFDGKMQAIYLFDKEKAAVSECYGACADAWPPVLTDGEPVAAGAVRADLLGTAERTDGTTQVTYAGHPLYYYVAEGPGEVKCHKVRQFGGLWLVVGPDGNRRP